VNLFAGNADPSQLIATMKGHPEVMTFVDESMILLLKELFQLRLFENPYVNEEKAVDIVGKKECVEAGKEAQRKSVVLLRNKENQLPLPAGTKVYFEDYQKNYHDPSPGAGNVYDQIYEGITFVNSPEEADVVLLWLKPSIRPLFPADDSPLEVDLSSCAIDTDYVNALTAKKPTILAINYSNPFAINEIYNEQTKNRYMGVLATFGVEPDALLDIISGKYHPTGKMPFTTTISQQAVETNKEDVPGYDEGPDYALFNFGEGLAY
jgi:beta-glucosidase